MTEHFFENLYLLFLARQGYWTKENEVSKKNLFFLTYQYFLISFFVFIGLILFSAQVKHLLEINTYKEFISYYDLLIYGLYIVLFVGVIYENYFVLKTNTINSIYIFFRIPLKQVRLLVFIRNLIIILPALIFLTIYQGGLGILLFCTVHLLSLLLLPKLFNLKKNASRQTLTQYTMPKIAVNAIYVRSVLGITYSLKNLLTPFFSLMIFVVISFSSPDLFEVTTFQNAIMLGILCGSIFFQSKHLSFGFLCLNNDLSFFKSIDLSITKYVTSIIKYLNVIQLFFMILVFSMINLFYFKWTQVNFIVVVVGLCLAFFLINSVQMMLASEIRSVGFKKANELEAYKIPLKLRMPKFAMNIYMTIIILAGNYFSREISAIGVCIIIGFLFLLPIFLQRRKLLNYLGEI